MEDRQNKDAEAVQANPPARPYTRPQIKSEPATERFALFTSCGTGNQTFIQGCAAGY